MRYDPYPKVEREVEPEPPVRHPPQWSPYEPYLEMRQRAMHGVDLLAFAAGAFVAAALKG